jgi:phosphoribosylglycinamide formyltransferase-1
MTRIAVFASGNGTNAENLIRNLTCGKVVLLLCNKPGAYVLERARQLDIPSIIFSREELENPDHENSLSSTLQNHKIDFIILAGFLWKIPEHMVRQWPGKILNIHPALLPKYGGPGMYGERVHKAVLQNGEKESGITIHIVDRIYDHGQIIFQAKCTVDPSESPETLATKIHHLEHIHFPKAADDYISQIFKDQSV